MKYIKYINFKLDDKNYTLKILNIENLFNSILGLINKFLWDNNLEPRLYNLVYYDKDNDPIYIKSKECLENACIQFNSFKKKSFNIYYEKMEDNETVNKNLTRQNISSIEEGLIPLNNDLSIKMSIREYQIFKMYEYKMKNLKLKLEKYKNECKIEKKIIFKQNNEKKLMMLDHKIKNKSNIICDDCGVNITNLNDHYYCKKCKNYDLCSVCIDNSFDTSNCKHNLIKKNFDGKKIKFKVFLDSCEKIIKDDQNDTILINMSIINTGIKEIPSDFYIINKSINGEEKVNIGNLKKKEKKNFSINFDIESELFSNNNNCEMEIYGYSNSENVGEEYILNLLNNEKIEPKLKKKKKKSFFNSLFNFCNYSKKIF